MIVDISDLTNGRIWYINSKSNEEAFLNTSWARVVVERSPDCFIAFEDYRDYLLYAIDNREGQHNGL